MATMSWKDRQMGWGKIDKLPTTQTFSYTDIRVEDKNLVYIHF